MTLKLITSAAAVALTIAAMTQHAVAKPPVSQVSVECNWGQLTMEQIQNGFDQGEHASDPEGDGRGNTGRRAGLANVLEQGNLEATCEFIEMLLEGD